MYRCGVQLSTKILTAPLWILLLIFIKKWCLLYYFIIWDIYPVTKVNKPYNLNYEWVIGEYLMCICIWLVVIWWVIGEYLLGSLRYLMCICIFDEYLFWLINLIIANTSLSGNNLKKSASNSIRDFTILKHFNVSIHHSNAR
jgi:hypothetical protein